jgi:hypothetical protein
VSIKCRDNNVVVVMFVSRVVYACENLCGFFCPLFRFSLPRILPQKIREKRLARDDDDDDDVFSNDDDDDEFGCVVLEITHQKTPIITACY